MIARAVAEGVFRDAIVACDPARRVRDAIGRMPPRFAGRRVRGLAVGKAALAMASGVGPVGHGLVISPHPGDAPPGWTVMVGAHPEPDERSVAAGRAAQELVAAASSGEVVLALISGGASALLEVPRLALAELRAVIRGLMHAGAPIAALNTVRCALSAIKGGQLARGAPVPVVTYALSDVIGDELAVIGSGPTIGSWTASPGSPVELGAEPERLRQRAVAILGAHGLAIPALLASSVGADPARLTRDDHAEVIAPLRAAADAAVAALRHRGLFVELVAAPLDGELDAVAEQLAGRVGGDGAITIGYGEPTLRVPTTHGEGGRAQQLALQLARRLAGTPRSALVVGTDGIDGAAPAVRPAPAGAFVDGTTWDAIVAAGRDPFAALGRCDAGTVLAAVGALVVTGPTGINHADLVIVG